MEQAELDQLEQSQRHLSRSVSELTACKTLDELTIRSDAVWSAILANKEAIQDLKFSVEDASALRNLKDVRERLGTLQEGIKQIQASFRKAKMDTKRKVDALKVTAERDELFKREQIEPVELTALQSGAQLTDALRHATQMMSVELEKSVAAAQVLDDSTKTMKATSKEYTTFSSITDTSKKILTKLQIQSMMDRLIILGGLTTFLTAAGYVGWKRLWLPRLPTFSKPSPPITASTSTTDYHSTSTSSASSSSSSSTLTVVPTTISHSEL